MLRSIRCFVNITVLCFSLFYGKVYGQDECIRADIEFNKKEYRTALYFIKKCVVDHPDSARLIDMRGICYVHLNQLDSAEHDFTNALRLDSTYHEAYFNLGLLYSDIHQYEKSNLYFSHYLELGQGNRSEAYYSMAMNYFSLRKDSLALPFVHQAYQADSSNVNVIYVLMMESMKAGNHLQALQFANQLLGYNGDDEDAMEVQIQSYIELEKYPTAVQKAREAINKLPHVVDFYLLKYRAELLNNMAPGVVRYDSSGRILFTMLKSNNLDYIDQLISQKDYSSEPSSPKGNSPSTEPLGLDDYFFQYYSQVNTNDYAPYGLQDEEAFDLMKQKKFDMVISHLLEKTSTGQIDIQAYYLLANAYFAKGDYEMFDNFYKKYFSFVQAILATGTGNGFDTAMIVVSPKDEYIVLGYNNFTMKSQSLQRHGRHFYDILTCSDKEGKEIKLFFNIDNPIRTLDKSFKGKSRRKKKSNKD